MIRPHRRHPLWFAFILHRVSGVALALFLPVHFWILSQAVAGGTGLDRFLSWTDNPLVKLAEYGLVFLLGVHLFGGLRLLALEWLPWSPRHKSLAAGAVAVSLFFSTLFFLQAV